MTLENFNLSCPAPILNYDTVQLAHGAGGRLSAELIEKVFLPFFGNDTLNRLEDQAQLENPGGRLAFTTDSFVVSPVFFPGGNIGDLAVNGTVNDICMSGAEPLCLSVGMILEEGLPIAELLRIVDSIKRAVDKAGVKIVTGDTKVVNKGSCDKIFINTSGIGVIPDGIELGTGHIRAGDQIILSGAIADHGMSVMTTREGLSFDTRIESDSAALNQLVNDMITVGGIKAMRDPTRGGVATTLNEWAGAAKLGVQLQEASIPIRDEVKGACEILGIDPLYVANEGKLLAVVSADQAETLLDTMRKNPLGKEACRIGQILTDHPGKVTMANVYGVERIIDMPIGEQLPRIC